MLRPPRAPLLPPHPQLLSRGFRGAGIFGPRRCWSLGWRKGCFRGASASTQKVKGDFRVSQPESRAATCNVAEGGGPRPGCGTGSCREEGAGQAARGCAAPITRTENCFSDSFPPRPLPSGRKSAETSAPPHQLPKLPSLSLPPAPAAQGRRCWVASGQWGQWSILCHWAPAT